MQTCRIGHVSCALLLSLALLATSLSCAPSPAAGPAEGTAAAPSAAPTEPTEAVVLATPPPTARASEQATQAGRETATPPPAVTTVPTTTVTAAEDPEYAVDLIVNPGVLQVHGRYETEYRELAPGPASLTSGSYLRTLKGEAYILLPGESILKMGADTEVQLGMYENGIMIWQQSGQTWHFVEPREGAIYEVASPFMKARAVGTEYEVRVDYPAQGWVTVYWGHVGVVGEIPVIDPVTGQTTYEQVWGFVPEGVEVFTPEDAGSTQADAGDTMAFTLDEHGNVVPDPSPPGGGTMRPTDLIVAELRRLAAERQAGRLTRDEWRNQMTELLGSGLASEPSEGEAPPLHGGLWGGSNQAGQTITFCLLYSEGATPSMVTSIKWVIGLNCRTLDTNAVGSRWDVWDLGGLGFEIPVDATGHFAGEYTFPEGDINEGSRASLSGELGAGVGLVLVEASTRTSVEACLASDVINVQFLNADCY